MQPNERHLQSLSNEAEEEIFDKADMKRPESARLKLPKRDSLFGRGGTEGDTGKFQQQNEIRHTPVKEAQEQEEDAQDYSSSSNGKTTNKKEEDIGDDMSNEEMSEMNND